jgi:glucuronate isomerase
MSSPCRPATRIVDKDQYKDMPDDRRAMTLNADRLLPVEPRARAVARRLYDSVRDLPLISPHGHVDPGLLLDNAPFSDPAALFVTPDHYITRLLHADGVPLDELGVGERDPLPEATARAVWRLLCERWALFRGTPVKLWLEAELVEIFDVAVRPAPETADLIYDQIATRLSQDAYRPRQLYERFGLEVLTTTTDPADNLADYDALAADSNWAGRVIPAFRPDRYLEVSQPGWADAVGRLGEAADVETGNYGGFVAALESRRRAFIERGATSADHSHADVGSQPLDEQDATRIYRTALAGEATESEAVAFRRHMLFEMARMSCDDGLVMTLHPGVRRNHHPATAARFGGDTGHDIPIAIEFTDPLRPLLKRFGTYPGFHLVVFTLDETAWSRELAPLAGFYPAVYVGVPWWFLDAPDAILRFLSAVTETAGFSRTSGFVDDTRAFCSIPARHDMARRLDATYLARLVCEHRLEEDEAFDTARDLVTGRPRVVFKL